MFASVDGGVTGLLAAAWMGYVCVVAGGGYAGYRYAVRRMDALTLEST